MKVKAEIIAGVMLKDIPTGSTFVVGFGSTPKIYMKCTLQTTAHITFKGRDDNEQRIAVVDCENGEIKALLNCQVTPVPTILVNDK